MSKRKSKATTKEILDFEQRQETRFTCSLSEIGQLTVDTYIKRDGLWYYDNRDDYGIDDEELYQDVPDGPVFACTNPSSMKRQEKFLKELKFKKIASYKNPWNKTVNIWFKAK